MIACGGRALTETGAVVDKVTWQKVGRVTEPGRYMFRFGWLTVTADDLKVWERFPEAVFTLVKKPDGGPDSDEYHLGLFELPSGTSLDPG